MHKTSIIAFCQLACITGEVLLNQASKHEASANPKLPLSRCPKSESCTPTQSILQAAADSPKRSGKGVQGQFREATANVAAVAARFKTVSKVPAVKLLCRIDPFVDARDATEVCGLNRLAEALGEESLVSTKASAEDLWDSLASGKAANGPRVLFVCVVLKFSAHRKTWIPGPCSRNVQVWHAEARRRSQAAGGHRHEPHVAGCVSRNSLICCNSSKHLKTAAAKNLLPPYLRHLAAFFRSRGSEA